MGSILKQLFSRDRHSHCPKYWQQSKQSFFFFFFKKDSKTTFFFKKSRQNYTYIFQVPITNKYQKQVYVAVLFLRSKISTLCANCYKPSSNWPLWLKAFTNMIVILIFSKQCFVLLIF